ncbi:transposase [Alistipes sp. OttesenSCG-928-L06]|nr:transposase [Alistipes sp. OttesenSCG-928-L06]
MGIKRSYDRSFKERAVKLSYERESVKALAAELGISAERLYKWRAEFAEHGEASFQGHGVERLSEEGRQVKELQKKLRNTEMELEILKKAIAVFSKIDR